MQPQYPPNYSAPPQYAMPPQVPQYAPQQQVPQAQPAYAPQATPPAPTGSNPFTNPAPPGGGGASPRPRDMQGCLVAYAPRKFTKAGTEDNLTGVGNDQPNDRVTADLFVLDTNGQPIAFGGSPEWERRPKPHTHQVVGPARFPGVWITNKTIVQALAPGGTALVGGLILGIIERSQVGQMPFNLIAVDDKPELMAKALQIWNALTAGQLQYNEPTEIAGAQGWNGNAPQGQVQYVAPQQSAPVVPQYLQPAPVAQPAVDPAYAAWQAQQAQSAVPQMAAPQGPPAPPGWAPQAWAGLTPEQQGQVLSTITQPQAQQVPQNGNPF
jgi:hypothetical protein